MSNSSLDEIMWVLFLVLRYTTDVTCFERNLMYAYKNVNLE